MLTDGVLIMQHSQNESGILLMNPSLKKIFKTSDSEDSETNTAVNGVVAHEANHGKAMMGSTGGGGEDYKSEEDASLKKHPSSFAQSVASKKKKESSYYKLMNKKRFNERVVG
jgi:hypothetical protein